MHSDPRKFSLFKLMVIMSVIINHINGRYDVGLTWEFCINIHFLEMMIDVAVNGQSERTCKSLIPHSDFLVFLLFMQRAQSLQSFPNHKPDTCSSFTPSFHYPAFTDSTTPTCTDPPTHPPAHLFLVPLLTHTCTRCAIPALLDSPFTF